MATQASISRKTIVPVESREEPTPFLGMAKARLDRADEMLGELEVEIRSYISENPLKVTFTGRWDGGIEMEAERNGLGMRPGLLFGDVIHNLRTSLDLMASEIARFTSGDDEKVHFPFSSDKTGLAEQIKSKRFNKCGTDAALLLQEVAPYHGGNSLLRALHDLDIQDKHKALVIHESAFSDKLKLPASLAPGSRSVVYLSPQVSDFTFPKDSPLAGRAVLSTVIEMRDMVVDIVTKFEAMVLRRPGKTGPAAVTVGPPKPRRQLLP